MTTKENILAHQARYPLARPQDLFKFLHQSVFGPGHLVRDDVGGLEHLLHEAADCATSQDLEPLDGPFVRAHLGLLQEGLAPKTLWRCFVLSAAMPAGTAADLEEKLAVLSNLSPEFSAAADQWRAQGFPALRHSEAFRSAYAPAYRVLHKDYAWMLPLLTAIDRKRALGRPILAAIEGGSAAGKTTLAEKLQAVYGCPVLHMDGFFLQPHQRTAQRLAAPGGNIDHERFLSEVLLPAREGRPIHYRRWDCHRQSFCPTAEISPAPLILIEGAYSCHPALAEHYDLRVFLSISPQLQRRRIQKRNTPEFQERFFSAWIPMERRYFDAFGIPAVCDLTLEVTE